ncbi:MAG: fadD3 5, partial [Aeromicrobium sp.]|nr:fadD3 5 [Aeromicrobium sp.]
MPDELTLGRMVRENAQRFGDVPAYVDESDTLTHADLHLRATRLASALAALGMRRQDRLSILARNGVRFGEVLAAGQLSGIVVGTVSFRLAPPDIARTIADTAPRVLICEAEFLPAVRVHRAALETVTHVVVLDPPPGGLEAGEIGYAELLASGGDCLPFEARPDDIACLIYTSGTTGRAKGGILGQREMRRLAQIMNGEMRTGSHDRILLVMPLFHIGAMAMGLGVHDRGGTALLRRQFEPAATVTDVATHDVTVLHLAPTLLQAMLDERPSAQALAGVRTVVYSAAPITSRTLDAAMAAMPSAGFLNLYGQTEVITSGLPRELHSTDGSDDARRRLRSVGHPFPDTAVRLVDDGGHEVASGEPGEISVRSPAMFRGYWNNSAATSETLRDGWCHTGDIGVMDSDGILHLVDRKKDVVISGGENVYCPEVEEAVLSHPSIAACAVIGLPDDRWGEAVTAVVVAEPGAAVDPDALQAH